MWLTGLGLAAVHHQDIADWWQLRNYQAPASVSLLASQDSMNDYGRKIFYVNHPDITAKKKFPSVCPSATAEQTIVLGCYHSGQDGIYLLDVTDQRLDGVEQVTAAHEMLHAAYERLSQNDRNYVNGLLEDYYKNDLKDERVLKTIDAYKKTEPHDVVNEMHSIFGTEIQNLPAPLENYYKRYFKDRKQVAVYAARYQSEFASRQDAVTSYDAQLASMKPQIDSLEADIHSKQSSIAEQQKRLVALKSSGNISAYNASVPPYNNLIDVYNAEVAKIHDLINTYNQLVATRNAVALEENELVKDLSTQAETINN